MILFTKQELTSYFEYLDELRESGDVDMWGASLPLAETFSINQRDASDLVGLWIKSFDPKLSPAARAKKVAE